jgi:hypothetical protein
MHGENEATWIIELDNQWSSGQQVYTAQSVLIKYVKFSAQSLIYYAP